MEKGIAIEKNDIIEKLIPQKNLSDVLRILIPLYATYIVFALSVFLVFIPWHENHMLEQKKDTIRQLTNSAVSLLAEYETRVSQGEMTLEAAQDKAAERIRNLRYGLQGKDYFWIIDMHPHMIMHPYRPDLEGEDLSRFSDSAGNYLFVAMVETVKEDLEGYVEYYWQWKDMPEKIVPKMSFVRLFAPWDWIIGTGIYKDDITNEINAITRRLALISGGVLFIIILMSLYISRQVIRINYKKTLAEKDKQLEKLRLKKLYELSQMSEQPIDTITSFALEKAISLTGSEIGFLAFLNDDESSLTMHTWSRQAMIECEIQNRVLEYSVEDTGLWALPARTRKPRIINDYEQFDSPEKKGFPEGHTVVSRIMTIPVFYGEKMVAVAGVGNKPSDYNKSDVRQLQLMMDGMWKIIQKKKNEDDLRQSEEKLQRSNTDLKLAQRIAGIGNYTIDPETGKRFWSDEVYRIFEQDPDAEPLSENEILQCFSEPWRTKYRTAIQKAQDKGVSFNMEFQLSLPSQNIKWIFVICEPEPAVGYNGYLIRGTLQDITERKRMERRMQQSQKMEALGTLAGGIAHDFNNILSSIIGFTELAKMDVPDNSEVSSNLEQVMAAGLRARDLVRHILTFSRKADVQQQIINIVPLVKECLKFIKASASPDIDIRKNIFEKDLPVLADPTQVHQMIMNLLANAVHAMKENGGTLDLTVKSVTIYKDEILQSKNIDAGQYVQILVSDTGCGISRALKEKIFEPFFTTKRRGEGTGMGLSTVYGIVKDLEGDISVYSEPGSGATFQVLIPQKSTDADLEFTLPQADLITGKGRILIVDDEKSIVAWTSKVLSKLGYYVVGVFGGHEAVDELSKDPGGFDLVITDLAMPEINGLELSKKIKHIRPDIPIILCTGFSEGLKPDLFETHNIISMVMKPMIASELSGIVNKALIATGKSDGVK